MTRASGSIQSSSVAEAPSPASCTERELARCLAQSVEASRVRPVLAARQLLAYVVGRATGQGEGGEGWCSGGPSTQPAAASDESESVREQPGIRLSRQTQCVRCL